MIVLYSVGLVFSCLMAYKALQTVLKEREHIKLIADCIILAYSVGTAILYLAEIVK